MIKLRKNLIFVKKKKKVKIEHGLIFFFFDFSCGFLLRDIETLKLEIYELMDQHYFHSEDTEIALTDTINSYLKRRYLPTIPENPSTNDLLQTLHAFLTVLLNEVHLTGRLRLHP